MTGFAGQAATLLFGRGVIRVAQFVAFVLLARILTAAEFGWFGILTTAIALAAMLGSLGLRQSFAYEIGQDRLTAGEAVGTALVVWPVLTVASSAVVIVLYAGQVDGLATSTTILIVLLGVAGSLLHMLLQGVFLGTGAIWKFTLSEALPRLLLMLGVVGLALSSMLTFASSLWLQVGTFLVSLPAIIFLATWRVGGVRTALHRLGPLLGYGLIFAVNLFLVTLSARLSMFVIQAVDGAAAAGQFFAAARVNEIFLEAAVALGLVLFSRAARERDAASAIRRGVEVASWLFWLFLLLAVFVVLLAPVVLAALLGDGYADAAPALQILALGMAPTAASKMIYPSLAGTGYPYFGTPVLLGSLAINAGLAIALVPALGVVGGAIAVVSGQYALLVGYAITCRLKFGVPLTALISPRWSDLRNLRWREIIARWRRKRGGQGNAEGGPNENE